MPSVSRLCLSLLARNLSLNVVKSRLLVDLVVAGHRLLLSSWLFSDCIALNGVFFWVWIGLNGLAAGGGSGRGEGRRELMIGEVCRVAALEIEREAALSRTSRLPVCCPL